MAHEPGHEIDQFATGASFGGGLGITSDYRRQLLAGSGRQVLQSEQGGQALAGGREQQGYALDQYRQAIEGQGPSVAQQQMQAGAESAAAQQIAMAGTARGGNLAGAQMQAQQAGVGGQQANIQQMGILRAQEQQAALQGLAGLSSTMAGQGLQQQMGMEQLASQQSMGQRQQELDRAAFLRQQQAAEQATRFQQISGGIKQGTQAGGTMIGAMLGAG